MKQVRVVLTCDEGFVAVSMMEMAEQIAFEGFVYDEYYLRHGTAIIEPFEEDEE